MIKKTTGTYYGESGILAGSRLFAGCESQSRYFLSLLAQGEKEETILADYPDLEQDDLRACLAYAHAAISHGKLDSLHIPA